MANGGDAVGGEGGEGDDADDVAGARCVDHEDLPPEVTTQPDLLARAFVIRLLTPVPVKQPRVTTKRVDAETGERKRFTSAILPASARKSPAGRRGVAAAADVFRWAAHHGAHESLPHDGA